jgi:hypothetical protein
VIKLKTPKKPAPTHDYRAALQNAVAWLGNRYLLAEPLNRRPETDRRPSEPQAA